MLHSAVFWYVLLFNVSHHDAISFVHGHDCLTMVVSVVPASASGYHRRFASIYPSNGDTGSFGMDHDGAFGMDFDEETPETTTIITHQNAPVTYVDFDGTPLPEHLRHVPPHARPAVAMDHAMQPYRALANGVPNVEGVFAPHERPLGLQVAIDELNEQRSTPYSFPIDRRPPLNFAETMSGRTTRQSPAASSVAMVAESPERDDVDSSLPKDIDKWNKDKLVRAIKKYHQAYVKMEEEIHNLRGEIKVLQSATVQLAGGKKGKTKVNAEVLKSLKAIYTNQLFRKAPWIRNDPETVKMAEKLFDLYFSDDDPKKSNETFKMSWIKTYAPKTKQIVNGRRSYIQSQCKLAVFEYYQKFNKMPALEDITRCATRDLDLDQKEDYDLFEWYWGNIAGKFCAFAQVLLCSCTRLLTHCSIYLMSIGKVVGHQHWGDSVKFYNLMSEAKCKDTELELFTSSTEAYIYIMVDNCFNKWHEMCKYYAANGNWKTKLARTRLKKTQREVVDAENNELAIDKMFDAKYSSPDKGQQEFGSFSKAGRIEHKHILTLINQARELPSGQECQAYRATEVEFLKKYRDANKIKGRTYEEQCKLRGTRKRKRNAGDGAVEIADTIDEDEEEMIFD